MALNATIYKFDFDISDLDAQRYASYSTHVALHPSETLERMTVRLIAYCMHASEQLRFTKGLSTDNEPDLWQKNYSDEIDVWIEVGLPDAKRIKRACSLSREVFVYSYGQQGLVNWAESMRKESWRYPNLTLLRVDQEAIEEFASHIKRTMAISCVIEDGNPSFSWDDQMLEFPLTTVNPKP